MRFRPSVVTRFSLILALGFGSLGVCTAQTEDAARPSPLLKTGEPTQWWFAFKFNAETFPRASDSTPACMFGGKPGGARGYSLIGQDYVVASKEHPALAKGAGYIGEGVDDPLGATFNEVYMLLTES